MWIFCSVAGRHALSVCLRLFLFLPLLFPFLRKGKYELRRVIYVHVTHTMNIFLLLSFSVVFTDQPKIDRYERIMKEEI